MKSLLLVLVIISLAGGYFYITRSQPQAPQPIPSPTSQPLESESVTDIPVAEAMVVDVEAGSFYFTPDTITVKKGQPVKIVMTSVDAMHDFVIDELNIQLPIVQNGDTGEIEFTPDTVGEFEYYCSVGEHRANGQVGTLIVTE